MNERRRGSRPRDKIGAARDKPDRTGGRAGTPSKLAVLDDRDTPLYSVGQAAEALGTRPAALRRLDAAGVLSPGRSSGGQRRYSRRQLERAGRIQAYVADGTSAALAGHIVDLEDEVEDLREQLRQAREALAAGDPEAGREPGAEDPAMPPARRLPGPRESSD